MINKNFTKLVSATFITRFGDSLDTIAFSWLVYVMTGSRALMGAIFAISLLPNIFILPFAGVLADTVNKKVLSSISDILRGTAVLLLALLYMNDLLLVWHLFAFVIVNNIFESIADPARSSILQSTVSEDDLIKGNGYLSSSRSLGGLIGISLAGILIGVIGIGGVIAIDAITFFGSGIIILSMNFIDKRKAETEKHSLKMFIRMIGEGFTYLKDKKFILTLMAVVAFINLAFVPFNILEPVYVAEVLNLGVEGLTYLGIAILLGMTIGGVIVGTIVKKFKPVSIISGGIITISVMYFLLGAIDFTSYSDFVLVIFAIILTFFFAFSVPIITAPAQGIIMKNITPDYIGRTISLLTLFTLGAMPLGGLVVSLIGDNVSVPVFYMFMGGFIFIIGIIFYGTEHKTVV